MVYEEQIELLEGMAGRFCSDPMDQKRWAAVQAGAALMRAAEPEDVEAEREHCFTAVQTIELAGDVWQRRDALMRERAAARAESAELRLAAEAAVAVYDRYCLHDLTVDEYDLGKALEAVRAVLKGEIKL